MEFYDYVKKVLDNLGVQYSAENDKIIEEIKAKLKIAFADFTQADAFYKDYLNRLDTDYKPSIDAKLALLSLPASTLSEQEIKDTIEDVKAEKPIEEPIGELEI